MASDHCRALLRARVRTAADGALLRPRKGHSPTVIGRKDSVRGVTPGVNAANGLLSAPPMKRTCLLHGPPWKTLCNVFWPSAFCASSELRLFCGRRARRLFCWSRCWGCRRWVCRCRRRLGGLFGGCLFGGFSCLGLGGVFNRSGGRSRDLLVGGGSAFGSRHGVRDRKSTRLNSSH